MTTLAERIMDILMKFEEAERGNRISPYAFAALRHLILEELEKERVEQPSDTK